jgi:hypothetical protein
MLWQPEPPEPPQRASKWKWLKGGAAFVTFMIAVAGAYTGIVSFRRSQAVDVKVTARETTFDRRSFDIGIVNESQRAVSITGGTLTFDGVTIGKVVRFVPGLGALDPRSRLERLASASRPPFSLAGGQAFAGTLEWAPPDDAYNTTMLDRLDAYIGRTRGSNDRSDDRYRLLLDLEPGDDKDVPVRLSFELTEDRRPQVGHRFGWYTMLILDSDRAVRGLTAYIEDPWPNVATLKVWGRASKPVLTETRPIVSSDRTPFALPARLKRGTYAWAITAGGNTVAVGRFRSPCPPGPSANNQYHEVHSEECRGSNR